MECWGLRIQGLWFRIWGAGFRIKGLGKHYVNGDYELGPGRDS